MPATTIPIAAVPVAPPPSGHLRPTSSRSTVPNAPTSTPRCAMTASSASSSVARVTTQVVIDADEARAVRLLEQAGLVPGSRHARKVG